MNEFYSDVVIGFNAWYLVAPAMLIAMWLVGVSSNTIDVDDLEIYEKDNEKSLKVMSGFLDLLLHVLVIIESGRGIFQVLLNHTDNPAYLCFVIPLLLLLSVVLTWYVLYMSSRFGKWTSLGYLVYARAIILDEREKKKKKRFKMITLEEEKIVPFSNIGPEIDIIK